jgi:hypothetical protein
MNLGGGTPLRVATAKPVDSRQSERDFLDGLARGAPHAVARK